MNFAPDLTTATGGLSAIKTGFELIKGVRELLKKEKVDAGEISNQLLELQQLLLDAQRSLGDTAEENRQLKSALSQEEGLRVLEADMEIVPDGSYFVRRSEREKNIFIPYCPVCWGHERKTVPLVVQDRHGYFECAIHKARFRTDAYLRAQAAAENRMMSNVTHSTGGDPSQRWMR